MERKGIEPSTSALRIVGLLSLAVFSANGTSHCGVYVLWLICVGAETDRFFCDQR